MNVKSKVLKIRNLPTDGRKSTRSTQNRGLVIAVFFSSGLYTFTRVYLAES